MELLSPAGNYHSALASLKGGADAIYLGGKSFSARMSADNFSDEEIKDIISYAHSINRKVYVTINTMIYQDEFFKAVNFALYLHSVNVDGLIIQDVGLAFYLHKVAPSLNLHASTQLNCHNLLQAKALKEIGFVRVVLAREANLSLIKEIKNIGLEVEVFIHGALCVSYSGNCLFSSFIGGRSGNRGRCGQPCRMSYKLFKNDKCVSDEKFMISAKDLMTLKLIDKLYLSEADSLKIEGRLKQDEYVYAVSKAYRTAIDCVIDNRKNNDIENDIDTLTKIFSRKFTKGYIFNESPFSLLNQETSSHQGQEIGKVIKTTKNSVFIKLSKTLHRLDGIRFNNKRQFGFTVEKMFKNSDPCEIASSNDVIQIKNIEETSDLNNVSVILTSDYLLNKNIESILKYDIKVEIKGELIAKINQPLHLKLEYLNRVVEVEGDIVLQALNKGTDNEIIKKQLSKSSNYPYKLKDLNIIKDDNIFVMLSSLNKIRNEAMERLQNEFKKENHFKQYDYSINIENNKADEEFKIDCVVEKEEQKQSLLEFTCYSNKDNIYHYMNRVESKPNINFKNLIANFILIPNKDCHAIASLYTNIANSYALDCYYSLGFKECMLSCELDYHSIKDLIDDYKNRHNSLPNVSIQIYGRTDLMVMKSCPIGTFYNNKAIHCQKCHLDNYELLDKMKERYPLISDDECNTRILNCYPTYLIDKIDEIRNLGISKGYLFFTSEKKKEIEDIKELIKSKDILNQKFTRGHYNKRAL